MGEYAKRARRRPVKKASVATPPVATTLFVKSHPADWSALTVGFDVQNGSVNRECRRDEHLYNTDWFRPISYLPNGARAYRGASEHSPNLEFLANIDIRVTCHGLLRGHVEGVSGAYSNTITDPSGKEEAQVGRLEPRVIGKVGGRLPTESRGEDLGNGDLGGHGHAAADNAGVRFLEGLLLVGGGVERKLVPAQTVLDFEQIRVCWCLHTQRSMCAW